MSGEPVLRHIEVPAGPGTRLTVWAPAGSGLTGPRPLSEGDGFTVNVDDFPLELGGGRWRAVLRSWQAGREGVTLELEVEGRYPE